MLLCCVHTAAMTNVRLRPPQRTTSGEQSLLIDGAQATLRGNDIIQVTTSQHPLPSIRLWDQPDPMTYEV